MSLLVNTISAIGNNNSFYPLLVRDCGIEAPAKVTQRYNQNAKESKIMAKHATRECMIDEYGSSFIWLGGVPLVEWFCNKFIDKKGINSKVNYKLIDENSNAMSAIDRVQQGAELNIDKFSKYTEKDVLDAVEDLKKAKANKNIFKKMTVGKYTAAIAIPVALMGFILPKSNFALSNYLLKKDAEKGLIPEKYLKDKKFTKTLPSTNSMVNPNNFSFISNKQFNAFDTFKKNITNANKGAVSFTGFASFMTGLTQQQKMAMTDGGLGAGRIGTSRKKNEAIENSVRTAGMMYLNFIAPKQIDKGLDKLITKTFGVNPSLDPKIIANKRFLAKVRSNKLDLPANQAEVIDFIDNNPKSVFAKIAEKQGEVKFLKSGVRDPRAFVDTEKVFNLATKMREFGEDARKSGNVKKYARKALGAKSASILTNIAISSSLLAIGLPQLQFAVRKVFFKSDVDPGLV